MSADRLALIGPATWSPLAAALTAAVRQHGLSTEVVSYGFGQDAAVWALAEPDFEAHVPQGAVVLHDARQLFQEYLADPRAAFDPLERGRSAAAFVVGCVERVAQRHPGIAWTLATLEHLAPGPGDGVADVELDPLSMAIDAFNLELRTACRERKGWSVFARDRISLRYGQATLRDPRMELLARFPVSTVGAKLLAERLAAHWAAQRGKVKKVLALDCDNTLWGGIVGEDGVQGIQIGSDGVGRAYAEFQQALLMLESRGVILALCSRNNPADVDEVLTSRPEMLLRPERISARSIGWGRKSEGLKELAATLNLGLDSFVFIDDNPVEREEIRQALPEVAVPDFPADLADLPGHGYDLAWRYFYRVSLSDEDRRRTEQYQARAQVEGARRSAGRAEEFLASLQMKGRVACDSSALVNRNAQLSQKTNQFNLTLRRYTESEMAEMTASPEVLVLSGALADRFADHGWAALAILKLAADRARWHVDSFLISCRVLGRGLEQEFAAQCIARARALVDAPIEAEFVPGPKNSQTARFFDELGFACIAETAEGRRQYRLAPGTTLASNSSHITFTWE